MVVSELRTSSLRLNALKSKLPLCCRVTYGRTLETSTFQFSTPDFVYMIMFGMTCMLV